MGGQRKGADEWEGGWALSRGTVPLVGWRFEVRVIDTLGAIHIVWHSTIIVSRQMGNGRLMHAKIDHDITVVVLERCSLPLNSSTSLLQCRGCRVSMMADSS